MAFDHARVNTKTHLLADGSDYCSQRTGLRVPMLEPNDGIASSTEGPAIVQYIADQVFEMNKLAPTNGTVARARLV
jgi:glutathione S-transferase